MAWRTTSWWKRCYEGLRGARVVSPFLRVFTGRCCVCWVCVVFVCFVCFVSVLLVKTPAFNSRFTFFCEFLVVDRPCPVLARQCRKKKKKMVNKSTRGCNLVKNGSVEVVPCQGVDMEQFFSVILFCFCFGSAFFCYLNEILRVLSVQAYVDDMTTVG